MLTGRQKQSLAFNLVLMNYADGALSPTGLPYFFLTRQFWLLRADTFFKIIFFLYWFLGLFNQSIIIIWTLNLNVGNKPRKIYRKPQGPSEPWPRIKINTLIIQFVKIYGIHIVIIFWYAAYIMRSFVFLLTFSKTSSQPT